MSKQFLKQTLKSNTGFTLVEMILVVTIIGLLSAVILSVINQKAQKARAQDAVNRSRMEQVTQALESFKAATDTLPNESNNAPVDNNLKEFINSWPENFIYKVSNNYQDFAVYVIQSNDSYLKYSSIWGDFKICKPTSIEVINFCDEI